MNAQLSALTLGFALLLGNASAAPKTRLYEATKSVVAEWAETEQLISREQSDWAKDRVLLEDLVAMLQAEKEDLTAKIEEARDSATDSDSKRSALMAKRDSLEEASQVVRGSIEKLEDEARALVPYLPTNYRESIAPLLRQLPKKGQPTELSVSIRLRNVVGILSQANKFDSVISIENETREFGEGNSKQVTTLYLGFAIAYYTDASGENAGYGYPTAEGWVWKQAPEHSESILSAIAMYQKGKQAEFVALPVVIN